MGTYVRYEANDENAERLNEKFRAETGDPDAAIIHSKSSVEADIAYIHSDAGSSQSHLRHITTIEQWNEVLPVCRVGYGQIKISGRSEGEADELQEKIRFLLSNISLLDTIHGLDDAVQSELVTQFEVDRSRIAWKLERIALGDAHSADALRDAKSMPCVTEEDRALLDRYANATQTSTDHVSLQDLASRIARQAPEANPIEQGSGPSM